MLDEGPFIILFTTLLLNSLCGLSGNYRSKHTVLVEQASQMGEVGQSPQDVLSALGIQSWTEATPLKHPTLGNASCPARGEKSPRLQLGGAGGGMGTLQLEAGPLELGGKHSICFAIALQSTGPGQVRGGLLGVGTKDWGLNLKDQQQKETLGPGLCVLTLSQDSAVGTRCASL